MRRIWRRYWPILLILVAASAVGIVQLAAWSGPRMSPPYAGSYDQIEDGLYLGGYVRELPPGVDAVLNLCELEDQYRAEVHEWQPIHDAPPAPSLDWLRRQVEFVDRQRHAGRAVFVHCHAGVSRSCMVVTAYLMSRQGWTRDEALAFVRTRRPGVQPISVFMDLLSEWKQETRK
jgi:Dual specificity phosphatase, catalytic domain